MLVCILLSHTHSHTHTTVSHALAYTSTRLGSEKGTRYYTIICMQKASSNSEEQRDTYIYCQFIRRAEGHIYILSVYWKSRGTHIYIVILSHTHPITWGRKKGHVTTQLYLCRKPSPILKSTGTHVYIVSLSHTHPIDWGRKKGHVTTHVTTQLHVCKKLPPFRRCVYISQYILVCLYSYVYDT